MNDACSLRRVSLRLVVFVVAAAITAMLSVSLGTGQAWAGAQPGSPRIEDLGGKTFVVTLKSDAKYPDSGYRQYQSIKSPNKKIANAKSSKPSVASVSVTNFSIPSGGKVYTLKVQINKPGTTKISYKFGNKKHTVKYVVKKYDNPLKSLKIGGKNYTSKFNPKALNFGSDFAGAVPLTKATKGKVSIKVKKGWKVKKCWYYTSNGSMKYFKNGAKLPKWNYMYIWVQKGSQREILQLFVSQPRAQSMPAESADGALGLSGGTSTSTGLMAASW